MLRTLPQLVSRASSFAVLDTSRLLPDTFREVSHSMLKSAFDDSKAQVFALESPRDLKEHFVESIEDYISDRCPFDRKHALEEIWEIEKDERSCVYSTDSPFDVPLHVLLETVENFNDDHGDRYKLKTATNIGSGVTRYIFAKESKPDHN